MSNQEIPPEGRPPSGEVGEPTAHPGPGFEADPWTPQDSLWPPQDNPWPPQDDPWPPQTPWPPQANAWPPPPQPWPPQAQPWPAQPWPAPNQAGSATTPAQPWPPGPGQWAATPTEPDDWSHTASWHYRPEHALGPPRHLAASRSRGGWRTALATLAALAVLAGIAATALNFTGAALPPRQVSAPSATAGAKPPATSSAEPSATAVPTMPTKPLEVLTKNPIYALKVAAKCPQQQRPATAAAFRKQVAALVDCQNKAWRKALAGTAVSFSKPVIKHYGSTLKTPCGQLSVSFPASYCTANRTLYFSKAAYNQGKYYRLAVAEFVIHEYAHHIQRLAGIFENTAALKERESSISRRIELQAHCLAQHGLTHSGFGFSAADRADLEYQFGYASDPDGHGSAKAERYWGRRGLDAKTVGACNTWKAKAEKVK